MASRDQCVCTEEISCKRGREGVDSECGVQSAECGMRSESRLIGGIVIAAMAFAVGTGVVTGVDFAIAKIWLVGDEIRVRDNVQPDYLVSSLLTDKVSLRVNGVGLGTSEKEMLRLLG